MPKLISANGLKALTIANITVMTLEESIKELTSGLSELSNLYEASVATGFALTDEGHHKVVELQEQVSNRCHLNKISLALRVTASKLKDHKNVCDTDWHCL